MGEKDLEVGAETCSKRHTVLSELAPIFNVAERVGTCNLIYNEYIHSVGESDWGWRGGTCRGHVSDVPINARAREIDGMHLAAAQNRSQSTLLCLPIISI